MSLLRGWIAALAERAAWLLRRNRVERDLDAELRDHLDRHVLQHVAGGMSEADARRASRLGMGGLDQVKEQVRDASGVRPLHDLFADVRFAARLLLRRPIYTLATTLTLALGIGATTGLFTVVNAVALRPLPYPDAHQLFALWGTIAGELTGFGNASLPDLLDWQARATAFTQIAGFTDDRVELGGAAEPVFANVGRVTAGFFATLGMEAVAGRLPRPGEFDSERRVAVASFAAWQGRFGGDRSVIGRDVRLGDESFEMIGVAAPSAIALPGNDTDLWVPYTEGGSRGSRSLRVVARVRSDRTVSTAQSEMDALGRQLAADYPDSNADRSVRLIPLRESLTGSASRPLAIFSVAALMVFLIACVNTIHLFHVGALDRRAELAVRTALGASRARLVQSIVVEAFLVAGLGGTAGIALAAVGITEFRRRAAADFPRLAEVAIDPTTVMFAAATSLAAAMLVGLLPALSMARQAVSPGHAAASDRSSANPRHRVPLLVLEVATTFILVFGAGLLLRTSLELQSRDPGIVPDRLISFRLTLPAMRYQRPDDVFGFHAELQARLSEAPGIDGFAAINVLPFAPGSLGSSFGVDGAEPAEGAPSAQFRVVLGDYFRATGMRLVQGRLLDPDEPTEAAVAVINESLAALGWPDRAAVGRELTILDGTYRVVGVVADVRNTGLDRPASPTIYTPFAQRPRRYMTYVVRHEPGAAVDLDTARAIVWSLDPALPLEAAARVDTLVAGSTHPHRNRVLLLGGMGILALVLSSIGIYGTTSELLRRRHGEIGIRLALGAVPRDVLRWGLRTGFGPVLLGAFIGVLGSLALARGMTGIVYGVGPLDPTTLVATFVVLAGVGLIASLVPSWRAGSIDPARSLRQG